MRLIKTSGISLFFPYRLKIEKEFLHLFDKSYIDNGYLDGLRVWQKLKELNEIENFAKKRDRKIKT